MENEASMPNNAASLLRTTQVLAMAVISLLAGLGIGYLMRSSQLAAVSTRITPHGATQAAPGMAGQHHPSLEEIKQIADKEAAPLLEKLKSNPNDSAVLVQVGAIYHTSHRFKEAAAFYNRALDSDPKNVAIRTKLASSLYRNGDSDGAIKQLNQALTYGPSNANALFDLGMIKLQGRGDSKGAIAAWQRLLKNNPQLSSDRRATVMKLMADAMTMMGDQQGIKNGSNHGHE
jgi:cytochrome c-type biogenesis protein CcmH/NrfG